MTLTTTLSAGFDVSRVGSSTWMLTHVSQGQQWWSLSRADCARVGRDASRQGCPPGGMYSKASESPGRLQLVPLIVSLWKVLGVASRVEQHLALGLERLALAGGRDAGVANLHGWSPYFHADEMAQRFLARVQDVLHVGVHVVPVGLAVGGGGELHLIVDDSLHRDRVRPGVFLTQ